MFAIIAVIIIAVVLAVALEERTPQQSAQAATLPDIKDGTPVIRVYGTVWIDNPMQLAMLNTNQTPIKKSA